MHYCVQYFRFKEFTEDRVMIFCVTYTTDFPLVGPDSRLIRMNPIQSGRLRDWYTLLFLRLHFEKLIK
jgi:hypothetical protein